MIVDRHVFNELVLRTWPQMWNDYHRSGDKWRI